VRSSKNSKYSSMLLLPGSRDGWLVGSTMNVVQLNYSDALGGAARAAYRIHHAVRGCGVGSRMLVNRASLSDPTVIGPATASGQLMGKARRTLALPWRSLLKTKTPALHSPACIPSRWARRLNASSADLVHLHWINCEMMSVADIGRLAKPTVWTLHDMWAFCGAEHYTDGVRWREGYTAANRPPDESGFDLNRWTWRRKKRHWRRPLQIVTPSRWLAACVEQSELMGTWPVAVIPNPIDTEVWQPLDKLRARQLLNRQQLSPATIDRMVSYFARHEVDKQGSSWDQYGKGRQAWDGWGGEPGRRWATGLARRMDAAEQAAQRSTKQHPPPLRRN